ncbi:MAG TPA: hypothetical protein VKG45_12420 [Actinomycetes bacterium]|nr:hypothetical protein [Actinomycetes bacterium]
MHRFKRSGPDPLLLSALVGMALLIPMTVLAVVLDLRHHDPSLAPPGWRTYGRGVVVGLLLVPALWLPGRLADRIVLATRPATRRAILTLLLTGGRLVALGLGALIVGRHVELIGEAIMGVAAGLLTLALGALAVRARRGGL